ncbi:MAG TPA: hypothetical protein VFF64_11735 [Candidatus Eremiobacteraceae bacterium]|nr:hypothetical protein [Candidatus Eremiobacteraceae bacterium]
MKKLFLLNLALCFLVLPLHAQNVWSSKIYIFTDYVKPFVPNANGIVSEFTPATAITINRVQLAAAGTGTGCTFLPGIKVTDGTTTIELRIPQSNGGGPVSNDTGVISVPFPASDPLVLSVIPGSIATTCNGHPFEVNIVVQYSVTAP